MHYLNIAEIHKAYANINCYLAKKKHNMTLKYNVMHMSYLFSQSHIHFVSLLRKFELPVSDFLKTTFDSIAG